MRNFFFLSVAVLPVLSYNKYGLSIVDKYTLLVIEKIMDVGVVRQGLKLTSCLHLSIYQPCFVVWGGFRAKIVLALVKND